MIWNTLTVFENQPDERRVLQGELAFVEKSTLRLFVPMTEEVWGNRVVFSNDLFIRSWDDMDEWFWRTIPTWEVIFKFDPVTLLKIEG